MLLPAISFEGKCDEAINFYKATLGAEVKELVHYKDAPADFVMDVPPNYVMHSEIEMFGVRIAMTDGATAPIAGDYFSFTLMIDSAEEVRTIFNKLAESGNVVNPLAQQFWATLCGDVTDKFGIYWHICTKG